MPMKYQRYEYGGAFYVSFMGFGSPVFFSFLDVESQTSFCVALDNAINMEEVVVESA